MKRRKWMALMLCAGIFMADFSGIPLKVSAEQVEQAETVLDDQGTQKDDGENTELIQETEDENNSEASPIETEPEERAAEDTTTEELPSTEVVTELKTTIVSNKTAREYVDRTVELTTNVEDAVGNVEYQYTEEYRGETAVVQEYAENPVYSFKTSGVGEHVYRVNVKDENGNIGSAEYKIEVVAHPSKVLSGKLTSNKTQKEYVDRKITLTAEATNGYGNYQYRFTEKKDGVETALQDYGDTNTYSFITKECGEHTYYVYIKDAEGQEIQLSYTMTVVLHPQKKLIAELSSNKTNREYIQRTVVLTAAAKGGYGKIKYQFSETYGSTTAVRQAYSEKNTYTFKTSGTGHHVFYVDMIDEQGQKSRASYEMDIVAHPDNVLTGSVTSNKTTKEYIDRNICLTANAKGGYGSFKYQFVESYNGKVTVVQKYSEKKTYSFKTTGPGTHTYYVYIKDKENQSTKLKYSMTVVVHPDKVIKAGLRSNKTTREYAKRTVTLTGSGVGGYGKRQYQFTEVYGATTKVRQSYSYKNTYSFTTTGIGTHIFYVDVKDDEGQVVRATYTMQVVVHPDNQLRGSFVSNTNGIAKNGQKIQLTATSSGGYDNAHRYRFREVYGGNNKVLQNYSTKKSCEFTFSGNGAHTYYVDILDSESQILTLSLRITSPTYVDRMSVFSTVSTNNENGTYNMSRALKSFNQVVIQPGQTLSFFGVAGPCGKAEGYKQAGVVGGVGYGGGICQASTTLYGAAIRAGLTIVQRRNHSVPSTYVPIGQDAMVDYGSSDLKFRNDYDYPVKLVTYVSGKTLYAEVWGIQPDWYDYVNVRSWSTGSKSAVAYRDYVKNGKTVKTEQLPSSYYK